MSKELPFFKFNATEWITGNISYEPFELQGAFISVCAEYWNRNNCLTIAEAKLRLRNSNLVDMLIEKKYLKTKKEKLVISFLDNEREEISAKRLKLSESGRKGGLSKAKASLKQGSSIKEEDKEEDKESIYRSFAHLSITNADVEKLLTKYSIDDIDEVLDSIENFKGNKKYTSLYLTASKWLSKNKKTSEVEEPKELLLARKLGLC
jgi:Rps23 Pro-64 3,4-dihydroxylase Tpa1-like proline 4-hydroxylase